MNQYYEITVEIAILADLWRIFNGDFVPQIAIDLKKTEIRTLMQIKFNEGKSMSFYCSKVELEHGSFTYIADKLESKGLLERVSLDGDRRKKILKLTETGKSVSDLIHDQFAIHVSEKLNLLDEKEMQQFNQALKTLAAIKTSLFTKINKKSIQEK